jgi:hypothetical protein
MSIGSLVYRVAEREASIATWALTMSLVRARPRHGRTLPVELLQEGDAEAGGGHLLRVGEGVVDSVG